jgi:ABC-type lipoprotein export system ATPase subunit
MKILSLHIENIRGIRSAQVVPEGRSFAIWGPNGSGKSAVVDAIDFLLTGRISRLEGRGTGGITLNQHGPHIDRRPEEAIISAFVQIQGHDDPIEISRCMAAPADLICNDDIAPLLVPILEVASRGQHVLTRREILKFITSDPSSRAEGIQELLNISEIGSIRSTLVRVRNDANRDVEEVERSIASAQAAIAATIQSDQYSKELTLEFANTQRAILGTDKIETVKAATLKERISLPKSAQGRQSVNVTVLEGDINNLILLGEEARKQDISEKDNSLRSIIKELKSDPILIGSLERLQLLELGTSLIDDSGDCPLCETSWEPGVLKEQLETRIQTATKAGAQNVQINELSADIRSGAKSAIASLEKITAAVRVSGSLDEFPNLEIWKKSLDRLTEALKKPLITYPTMDFPEHHMPILMAPEGIFDELPKITALLKDRFPVSTPEQTAWDLLTRLEENIKTLEASMKIHEDVTNYQFMANALHDEFIANIHPAGAGLALEVGFYGRGIHPPHALHSEGHQDSMGLCLYLSLAEQLIGGVIDLAILDDVIMSVDSSHRRNVCRLLFEFFPDKQFLITTHDKTWAHQLRSEGLVRSKDSIEFYKWSIDTGPYIHQETDLWNRVDSFLESSDVVEAAVLLRKGSEQFLAYVCDNLEAQVKYRLDARNDLGDFLPAAVSKYKSLLRKAKKAAHSWSNDEDLESISELETICTQVHTRTQEEQWAVNASIHFNNWENLSPEDFQPVRETIQDLHLLFICQDCGSTLRVSKDGMIETSLRCNCASVNWNLIPQSA